MSNTIIFLDSQEPEQEVEQRREPELELSMSQLPDVPLHSTQPSPTQMRQRSEPGGSSRLIRPRLHQIWHGNLQADARAMVILLQVGSVEPGGREVTFQGYFEGLNNDQLMYCLVPIQGGRGHTRFLEGPVEPLMQYERDAYIGHTIRRIIRFLRM